MLSKTSNSQSMFPKDRGLQNILIYFPEYFDVFLRPAIWQFPFHATDLFLYPVKYQKTHKMVKHTQTIRRQFADELFECVWSFCGFSDIFRGYRRRLVAWHCLIWTNVGSFRDYNRKMTFSKRNLLQGISLKIKTCFLALFQSVFFCNFP